MPMIATTIISSRRVNPLEKDCFTTPHADPPVSPPSRHYPTQSYISPCRPASFFIHRDLDEIEIGVAHVDRTDEAGGAGFPDRSLNHRDAVQLQPADDLVQRQRRDEAQIERSRDRDVRARLELPAPLVQVDLLVAEGEREALLGRRLELHQLHPERFAVEADAGFPVARGKDDVVDVVDHRMFFCLNAVISAAEYPISRRTVSVCSPNFGAAERIAPGVAESLGTIPGTFSGSPSLATISWIMPRARKCGSAAMSAAV